MAYSMRRLFTAAGLVCSLLVVQSTCALAASDQMACSQLSTMSLPAVEETPARITEATLVQDARRGEHCHVRGYIASQVGFELLLPTRNWNHKLIEFGCGGYCGSSSGVDSCPLTRGYACIATDTGHQSSAFDALWAGESWEAKIDWGYLAPHLAATFGKAIVESFFGSPPAKAYFVGASNGGRQALIEVQRFPWDFDGVVAVAPPIDISQTFMTLAWGFQAARDTNGKVLLGDAELKLLTKGALHKCGLDDGVDDEIIGDPLHCNFDPSELLCKDDSQHDCLSAVQVAAARKIYRGPETSSGHALTLGGPLPGSEFADKNSQWSGWKSMYTGQADIPPPFLLLANDGICYLFLRSCSTDRWNLTRFDFDRDYKRLRAMEPLYDASNPDLRRFRDAGGKLIIVQGLSDPLVSPREVINYYQTVERTMGGPQDTGRFARLFLLPGVDHPGGAGADAIDLIDAIDRWVEHGSPPEKLIAARLKDSLAEQWRRDGNFYVFPTDPSSIKFTRPVYPFPTRVKYKGRGDANDAQNFVPVQ
jgi:pimeloyl-ACP methyl ester carboxylesterase